jgi:D-alanyl-D-alanine-carboxypeptidase/D-alanyl-D-alanine-endopeptidase
VPRFQYRLAALALATCVFGCGRAPATRPPPQPGSPPALTLSPQSEAALQALYAESGAPGMVVAVAQGDAATVRGYGTVGPADPRTPDGATLVRLDSISKLLTAQLMAKMAAGHRLALTDPLTRYAPPGWAATGKDPPPITLLQLATHTSGLPRTDPTSRPFALPSVAEARAARWGWLAHRRDAKPPGVGASYSNFAFDLLGDALGVAAGSDYDAALRDQVTGPLGLADTTADPSPGQCARLMAGDPLWPGAACADQSYHAASGGLFSTGADMARWMLDQLAAKPDPARRISQAIYVRRDQLAYAEGLDHGGPASGVGLGWIELAADEAHPRLIEKTGGGYGFLTYVALDPERRAGVFLAINRISGGVGLTQLAADTNALVASLGGFRPAPPPPAAAGSSAARTGPRPGMLTGKAHPGSKR